MLSFIQTHWLTVLLGMGAVLCAFAAIIFGLRAYNSVGRYSSGVTFRRIAAAILCASLTFGCLAGCSLQGKNPGDVSNDPSTSQGDNGEPADPPEPPVAEPLPDVNLGKAQIDAFLEDYDLTFDDSSLIYGVGWRSGDTTMLEERKAAWKALGSQMTDGISFPYCEEVFGEAYDTEMLKLIDNISKLSDGEQLEMFKVLRHQIYQDIITNPVVGMAWLEMFSQNDLIMENNGYWITPNLEILQQLYDGTYRAPDPNDSNYAELMKIDLNAIPEPNSDVTCRGLDRLLVYNGPRVEVRQVWARFAVRICSVLEYFEITGITQRESSIHWHLLPQDLDNMVRATKADYTESEPAILLVYSGKDNREAIAYGSNLLDRRPMEYRPNVKEPPKVETSDSEDPPPEDPPKEDPPPIITPKTEYGTLTIKYVDSVTGELLTGTSPNPYTQNVAVGGTYSRVSPVIRGYALVDQSQSTISSNRYGTMTKSGITVTVPYAKEAEVRNVTVRYLYEDGTKVYEPKTYTLKTGDSIDEYAKPCPRNYWVSPEEYHDVMKDKDVVIDFIYHYLPLEAWKDPGKDPVNNGNADVNGGSNLPTDGSGKEQPTEPPRKDYPDEGTGSTTNPGSNRPDYDPNTGNSTTTLTPNDKHESSGQGGDSLDHEIKDANNGHTDNGSVPDKGPIDTTHNTTVTDPPSSGSSSSSGTTSNTSQEPANNVTLGEPD